MALHARTRAIDKARSGRLLLAWTEGDKLAADYVLGEAMTDRVGVPGLIFTLCETAAELAVALAPDDFADQLRRAVLEFTVADESPRPGRRLTGGASDRQDSSDRSLR